MRLPFSRENSACLGNSNPPRLSSKLMREAYGRLLGLALIALRSSTCRRKYVMFDELNNNLVGGKFKPIYLFRQDG